MSAESPTLPSTDASPFAGVVHLYRRICLLRAGGHADEASRLETTEFSAAMASIHTSGDFSSVAPLLTAEDVRIADAQVLAELLAPLLASRLAASPAIMPPADSARPKPSRRGPAELGGAPSSPTVADLIDGMLAQDRAGSRPN